MEFKMKIPTRFTRDAKFLDTEWREYKPKKTTYKAKRLTVSAIYQTHGGQLVGEPGNYVVEVNGRHYPFAEAFFEMMFEEVK